MNFCMRWFLAVLATIVLSGCNENPTADLPQPDTRPAPSAADSKIESPLIYTVANYDPEVNAEQSLAKTISLASASGKRIILEIGGQW